MRNLDKFTITLSSRNILESVAKQVLLSCCIKQNSTNLFAELSLSSKPVWQRCCSAKPHSKCCSQLFERGLPRSTEQRRHLLSSFGFQATQCQSKLFTVATTYQ